jgi:MOSC domain-containing protein YiiM
MAELQAGVRALPKAPSDLGTVTLIVCRQADGVRMAPEAVHLTPEEGVPGDGWSRRPPRDPDGQIAVMGRDVAELIANGQPLTVFGDNFIVELDLSAANLPAGTRLGVGEAVVEVTAKPHNGCLKFRDRFGKDALSLVQAPETRHWNLRGIYWKVVQAGRVAPASPIRVLSRPT